MLSARLVEDAVRVRSDDLDAATLVDFTPWYGDLPCFADLRPMQVMTNRHTYAPTVTHHMSSTWLATGLTGVASLRAHTQGPWTDIAVIGTGDGLDASGISRIARPRSLLATDIHPNTLAVARWNIERYGAPDCRFVIEQGDLLCGVAPEERFDLIYENLPNVPDGSDLFEGTKSASCYRPSPVAAEVEWDRWLLGLHHEFARQARPHMHRSGWTVSLIGGRIPFAVVRRMFQSAGLTANLIGFDIKIQTEPEVVLPAYTKAERRYGIDFVYYHSPDRCLPVFRSRPLPADLDVLEEFADDVVARLTPYRLSAIEALQLYESGKQVCHTIYVIGGQVDGDLPIANGASYE